MHVRINFKYIFGHTKKVLKFSAFQAQVPMFCLFNNAVSTKKCQMPSKLLTSGSELTMLPLLQIPSSVVSPAHFASPGQLNTSPYPKILSYPLKWIFTHTNDLAPLHLAYLPAAHISGFFLFTCFFSPYFSFSPPLPVSVMTSVPPNSSWHIPGGPTHHPIH